MSQPPSSDRPLDPSELLIDVSRQIEALAVAMLKHRLPETRQVCACGRLAAHVLPTFGLRCDVAREQWELTRSRLQRVLVHVLNHDPQQAVGRAAVRRP